MQQLRSAVRRFAREFFYTAFIMAISVKKNKLY